MNCKFHHKEHSGKAAAKKLAEKRKLDHEGHEAHEEYNENIQNLRFLRALRGEV